MKQEILSNLDNPTELEHLYRGNKITFTKAFNTIYPEIKENSTAQIWHLRLNYPQDEIFWGKRNDLIFFFIAALISGFIAKIPAFFGFSYELFLPKNIGFIVFPMLMLYFSRKHKLGINQMLLPIISILLSVLYINFLPKINDSNSILLACIHLPIFLWTVLGYSFVGGNVKDLDRKVEFLRYNGEVVVMTNIIMLAGIAFSGITVGLFSLIGFKIVTFYFENIAIWGVASVPLLATYLTQNNPNLVNKISPIIARIFTPLVFLTLLIFLSAIVFTRKNLFNDRDFLLLFNFLLIGVMAIIIFSVTEATKSANKKINLIILLGLSILTIITNGIALSAIAFRLFEFGISANRIAVLGGNLLIFANLIIVAYSLLSVIKGKGELQKVDFAITLFIPVYGIWAAFVVFIVPILFNFK
jgi:hypothetical protein